MMWTGNSYRGIYTCLMKTLITRVEAGNFLADATPAPASAAQRQMWQLSRLDPGTTTYLVPLAYRLHGPLDVPALSATLDDLVARHAALRTTLAPAADGAPGD